MILCKNGHENEEGATYCRVCHVYIDSSAEPTKPTEPDPKPTEPDPKPTVVPEPREPVPPTIALGDREVVVPLGGEAECEVWVRNAGPVEARYGVHVEGDAAEWSLVRDAPLALAPGAEGKAAVVFRPPPTGAAAGAVPFVVRVADLDHPTAVATGAGTVEVDDDVGVEFEGELVPVASRGAVTGAHRVVVRNKAAQPVVAEVVARGAEAEVTIEVTPATLTIAPGGEGAAELRVAPVERVTWGKRVHVFDVLVTPVGGEPLAMRGNMTQVGRGKWAAAAAAGAAVLGGAFVATQEDPAPAPPFEVGETVSFEPKPVPPERVLCDTVPDDTIDQQGHRNTGDLVHLLHNLLLSHRVLERRPDLVAQFDAERNDGIYGQATAEAVKAFQEAHHLHVDGIVGKETWGALCGG